MEESKKHARHILYGALWVFGGLIATAASERFIFWGAVVFGGFEFLGGIIGWIGASSDRKFSKRVSKLVDENLKIAQLEDANDYPALKEVRELIGRDEHDAALELLQDEMKTVHQRNKDIYRDLTKRFKEMLFQIYSAKNIAYKFDESKYHNLVDRFISNTDKLLAFIEKHGYDRVMLNSPNFGVGLSEIVIKDLQVLHKDNDEIDKEISKIMSELPKLG